MVNFMTVFSAAKLGNEVCTLQIVERFKRLIDFLSKDNQDLKSELTLEVLEQLKGERIRTFNTKKLHNSFLNDDSEHVWSEYVKNKFVLWTNLQLNRLVKKSTAKQASQVYIPWYVATAIKHYKTLIDYFDSHEEVNNFVESDMEKEKLPRYIIYAGKMLFNNLKQQGRKNLLDKVRIAILEPTSGLGINSTTAKPVQELKLLTKEFVLDRPCNLEISDRIKFATKRKLDQSTKDEFISSCSKQLKNMDGRGCNNTHCSKHYDSCKEEWNKLQEEEH